MCDLFHEKAENLWRPDEHIPIILGTMVGVAQLVELRIVIPAVVGSNPIVHPIFKPFVCPVLFCFWVLLKGERV